mmetsp:Transcript_16042/g.40618  ORF Transcript_16042/g.40618 Transcript_16042/m.40618 type:complete len:403 (+) Transcript_16042:708-1916(+)
MPGELHVLQDQACAGQARQLRARGHRGARGSRAGRGPCGGARRAGAARDLAGERGHRRVRDRPEDEPARPPGPADRLAGAQGVARDHAAAGDDQSAVHPGPPRPPRGGAAAPEHVPLPAHSGPVGQQRGADGHEPRVHRGAVQPGGRLHAQARARADARDRHHLRVPRGDGRAVRGDAGAGAQVPLPGGQHLAVLPAPGHAGGQDAPRAHAGGQGAQPRAHRAVRELRAVRRAGGAGAAGVGQRGGLARRRADCGAYRRLRQGRAPARRRAARPPPRRARHRRGQVPRRGRARRRLGRRLTPRSLTYGTTFTRSLLAVLPAFLPSFLPASLPACLPASLSLARSLARSRAQDRDRSRQAVRALLSSPCWPGRAALRPPRARASTSWRARGARRGAAARWAAT